MTTSFRSKVQSWDPKPIFDHFRNYMIAGAIAYFAYTNLSFGTDLVFSQKLMLAVASVLFLINSIYVSLKIGFYTYKTYSNLPLSVILGSIYMPISIAIGLYVFVNYLIVQAGH